MNKPGEETLIRYFRGECSAEEANLVRLYLALNIDGDYVKACLQEAWGNLESLPAHNINQELLNNRWQQWEERDTAKLVPIRKPFKLAAFTRYAAVTILLLSGLAVYHWLGINKKENTTLAAVNIQTLSTPKGKMRQLTLADGSVVTLFPGAEMQVASNFNQLNRTILLKGRAFFEVAQNATSPFYVKTKHLNTQVLGTAFEVNASEQTTISKVTLLNGKVSVSNTAKQQALLSPGQQLMFDSLTHQWQVHAVNAKDIMAWTSGEFIYENAILQQVFNDIESWYDVNINLKNDAIAHKVITTNFKGLPLQQVLTILSKASGFRYKITGKQIQISEATP